MQLGFLARRRGLGSHWQMRSLGLGTPRPAKQPCPQITQSRRPGQQFYASYGSRRRPNAGKARLRPESRDHHRPSLGPLPTALTARITSFNPLFFNQLQKHKTPDADPPGPLNGAGTDRQTRTDPRTAAGATLRHHVGPESLVQAIGNHDFLQVRAPSP